MSLGSNAIDDVLDLTEFCASVHGPWWSGELAARLAALSDVRFAQLADDLCDRFRARDRARRLAAAELPDFAPMLEHFANANEFLERLRDVETFLVFTSHPSELRPPEVVQAFRSIEGPATVENIESILRPLPKIRSVRPTVADEIQAMVGLYRETIFPAYHAHMRRLRAAIIARFGELADPLPAAFVFSTWAGGDRDGNPSVTAARTREAGDALHAAATAHLRRMHAALAHSAVPAADCERLDIWLQSIIHASPLHADAVGELRAMLAEFLSHTSYGREARAALYDFFDAFAAFGVHGASLEWRENAEIILRAYTQTNSAGDCERSDFSEDVADCLASLRELARLRADYGEHAVDALLISNCEDAATVLALEALARVCGVFARGPLPVVPLLESIHALETAPEIVADILASPAMLDHAKHIGTVEIMVGYSDAAKDGGRMMADHAIRTAQQKIAEVCAGYGLPVRIFHGRGGSPARGYGEIAGIFADADPQLPANKRKFTEQGEVLANRYGNRRQAECAFAAATINGVAGRRAERSTAADAAMFDQVSADAYERFQAVRNAPEFLGHLLALTPLATICMMPLGSRPSARAGGSGTITLDRLRAIPLNLAANLALFQLPAWYGTGSAWRSVIEMFGLQHIREFVARSVYAQLSLARAASALAITDVAEISRRAGLPNAASHRVFLEAAAADAAALLDVLQQLDIALPSFDADDAAFVLLRAMIAASEGDQAAESTLLQSGEPGPKEPRDLQIRFTLYAAMAAAIGVSG